MKVEKINELKATYGFEMALFDVNNRFTSRGAIRMGCLHIYHKDRSMPIIEVEFSCENQYRVSDFYGIKIKSDLGNYKYLNSFMKSYESYCVKKDLKFNDVNNILGFLTNKRGVSFVEYKVVTHFEFFNYHSEKNSITFL